MTLKERFLDAVIAGELGQPDRYGVMVKLKDFKAYFSDVQTDYINSFLPAATIEKGRTGASHTRYLFRVRKGVYRVHPEAIEAHKDPATLPAKRLAKMSFRKTDENPIVMGFDQFI